MHVLIPYALCDDPASRKVLRGLQLPHLQRLIAALQPQTMPTPDSLSHIPVHEQQHARLLGLNPQAPAWAALRARTLGLPTTADTAWGFITPCHWEIGQSHVLLRDPQTLQLSAQESRHLLDAMHTFFAEDGLTLVYDQPGQWLVHGKALQGLRCASLSLVIDRDVAPFLPSSALWRRLQNEMQMLLYTHPVNDSRAQQGMPAVNSFWLSGCGALSETPPAPEPALHVADTLQEAAGRQDWPSWGLAWTELDRTLLARLCTALDAGEPALQLTLCSMQCAYTYQRRPRSPWARIRAALTGLWGQGALDRLIKAP